MPMRTLVISGILWSLAWAGPGRHVPGLQLPSELGLPRELAELAAELRAAVELEKEAPELAKKTYAETLKKLQKLAGRQPNRVVEVTSENSLESRFVGLLTHVREIHRRLSPLGKATYRELFEPRATAALIEAGFRPAALTEILSLYPTTDASFQARKRLGDRAFEAGKVSVAAMYYADALRAPPADSTLLTPVLARYAVVSRMQGNRAAAKEAVTALEKLGERGDHSAFQRIEDLNSTRAARVDLPGPFLGGDLYRNWVSGVPVRPGRELFRSQLPVPQRFANDRKNLPAIFGIKRMQQAERGPGPDAPFFAVRSGSNVYVSSGIQAEGFELETGRLVFLGRAGRQIGWRDLDHPILYGPSISQGRLYASLIHRVIRGDEIDTIPVKADRPLRKVYAFDLKTGKALYELGGQRSSQPKEVRAGSFSFAPLPVGDKLLATCALVEESIKSYLCCFEPQRGELLWSTWLASGTTEATMFGELAREPFSQPVAVSDGVAYVVTGLGAIAAVSVSDGEILWESTYQPITIQQPAGNFPNYRELGWRVSPPLVSGELVVAAPVDSDFLYAFDRHNGALKWRCPRGDLTDLIGITGGLVLLQEDTRVACIDLESGRVLWTRPVGGVCTGRGALAAGSLLVPIQGGLLSIDLSDPRGARRELFPLPLPAPGNLVVAGDFLLFCGKSSLAVFKNAAFPLTGRRHEVE